MKLVAAMLLSLAALPARGDTRRIAVVVGNNAGAADRSDLHYAETDAEKIATTLTELGGVERDDLYLLRGRSLEVVQLTLDLVKQKLRTWRAENAGTHTVLIFFFSGHSDGESLELGRERLSFIELRRWLSSVGADVRLVIVDSCKSGAFLGAKGGHAGPAFSIRLTDDVASTGEALLTSTAADEVALESREIRGSFFTHHLVSGLRGAADLSRDGRVTLAEAYQYAFSRTLSSTANTTIGPQHPAYDYRMTGEGDFVLSDLSQRTAAVDLPNGFERILVQDQSKGQVLAEVAGGASARVALPAGSYLIRGWRDHRTLVAEVALQAGQLRSVSAGDFQATTPPVAVVAKGGDVVPRRTIGVTFAAGGGVESGIATSTSVHGGLRLGASSAKATGWKTTLMIASGRGDGFWETTAFALGGYRLGVDRGRLRLYGALEAAVGLVSQDLDRGGSLRSPSVGGAPEVGLSVRLSRTLAIGAEAQFLVGWVRKDGGNAALLLPGGWIGLMWTP